MPVKFLVVTELFNVAVSAFCAKRYVRYRRVFIVTELILNTLDPAYNEQIDTKKNCLL